MEFNTTTSDTKAWADAVRESFFDGFREHGGVPPMLLLFSKSNRLLKIVDFTGAPSDSIGDIIGSWVRRERPDAYVFICHGAAIKAGDPDKILKGLADGQRIEDMDGSIEAAVFVYETRLTTSCDIYEVIRDGDDAVISRKTLADKVESYGGLVGHLNEFYNNKTLN